MCPSAPCPLPCPHSHPPPRTSSDRAPRGPGLTNDGVPAARQAQRRHHLLHACVLVSPAHGGGQPQPRCVRQGLPHRQALVQGVVLKHSMAQRDGHGHSTAGMGHSMARHGRGKAHGQALVQRVVLQGMAQTRGTGTGTAQRSNSRAEAEGKRCTSWGFREESKHTHVQVVGIRAGIRGACTSRHLHKRGHPAGSTW